jgi:hypothetical protein
MTSKCSSRNEPTVEASAIHADLDEILQGAFTAFHAGFAGESWRGKERDCVNRFVMGYLVAACSPGRLLEHPTQIGIEVAVKQPPGVGEKKTAHKDVVIWPKPFMSCWNQNGDWNAVHTPLAVIEWKIHRLGARRRSPERDLQGDRNWVRAFSRENPESLGYSVFLDFTRAGKSSGNPCELAVSRCHAGKWQDAWLKLPDSP